jgi:hypothetical protein
MRESDTAQNTLRDIDIIAQPPFGSGSPFDPKKRSQFHWRVAWLCPLDHSRLKALAVAGSFSEILESIAKSAQVLCVHKQACDDIAAFARTCRNDTRATRHF